MPLPSQIASVLLCWTTLTAVSLRAQTMTTSRGPTSNAEPAPVTFVQGSIAWDAGHYPDALRILQGVLRAPGAQSERERVALLTGENWRTSLVAENARAPRWSADGALIIYEVGTGATRVTRVVALRDNGRLLAELPGTQVAISPDGTRIAWVQGATPTGVLKVRTLQDGRDRVIPDNGMQKAQMVFTATGDQLLMIAAPAGGTRTDVWAISLNSGELRRITSTDSLRSELQVVPGSAFIMTSLGGRSPVGAGNANAFARGARNRFALLDMTNGTERTVDGESPVVSANGETAAFFTRQNGRHTMFMMGLKPITAPQAVYSTTDSLAAPAISPDGSRVAFQLQPDHDWDVYTVTRDGKPPVRVTRDIQHDLLPRFVDNDHLIALTGEARHRRSQLYDLRDNARRRMFHNNTIRTIAPEYEWVLSPDGTKLLVVAERDGDTVTPHRHLWVVDLAANVTVAELQERVSAQLAAETALRADGVRRFAPIAANVRAATAQVSTDRVYRHEKALFDFDSKHITRPGNLLAREYLLSQYQSFGLEARFQPFEARTNVNQPAASTANVLAVLRGTEHPELVYVVSSHFDSRAEGPGADDNTSGTAALLEAARVLSTRPQPATIIFASFTGEESGLLGSREFVRQAKADGLQLVGALNNDMLGWTNDHRLDNTIRYSNEGIRDLQHAAAINFSDMITYDAFYYKSTDAAAFYDGYGDIVGGIGSYPVLGNPHYHQPHDVLEFENHQLIAEASKTTVASLMLLASSPSRLAGLTVTANAAGTMTATWTPSPEKGVVKYLVRYGPTDAPTKFRADVTQPRATLRGLKPGMTVQVKAVNRRGLEGWDWAKLSVPVQDRR